MMYSFLSQPVIRKSWNFLLPVVKRLFAANIFIIITLALLCISCSEKTDTELDKALSLYLQNQLEEALPLLESVVSHDKNNADACCWLAETYRRLGRKDDAVNTAGNAIAIDPCNSFAHTILADAYNPLYGIWPEANEDSAWYHLLKAVECDSTDGNAWLSIWTEAVRRRNTELEQKALHAFVNTGILSPAILAYNRWVLQHVPPDAILLTNGDMDTYPAVALQEVEGFRKDVAIVNYSLLNTVWYAEYIRDKYDIQLPFTESEIGNLHPYKTKSDEIMTVAEQIMRGWFEARMFGKLENPIAIANTVYDCNLTESFKDRFRLMGAYKLLLPNPTENIYDAEMMRKSLASINPDDFITSLASPKDRSSVRYSTTDKIVTNITHLAIQYSDILIEENRTAEALEMLIWAEEFEKKTVLGPVMSERINKLKELAGK